MQPVSFVHESTVSITYYGVSIENPNEKVKTVLVLRPSYFGLVETQCNVKRPKIFIYLVICLETRATHMEYVKGLSAFRSLSRYTGYNLFL